MAQISLRVDDDVKRGAEQALSDIGLSMSTAINVFLRKVAREHRIPFELSADVPNDETVEAIKEVDGVMFICADHGNAEQLVDYETGAPFTAHTTNPVPFILVNADPSYKLREGGCLADIVPTLIELMGKEQPAEMTGKSLLIK